MSDRIYKILFWPDINYEPGHWRPVMSIAQKVRNSAEMNCAIKFLCTPECKPIVESVRKQRKRLFSNSEIATVLEDLFPEGYSTLASDRPEMAHSRIEHCLKIAEGAFDEVLEDFEPDLLIAGYFVSMEALLVKYRYEKILRPGSILKIMITTTYLRHPAEDPAITSLRFLAHHSQEESSKLMRAAANEEYNGSFYSIQDFIKPLENVTELIACPKELDHDDFKHPGENANVHYVEPCILDTGSTTSVDSTLKLKTIYASAGSRVRDYVDSARTMFHTLKKMLNVASANSRNLEMAVGYTLMEEFDKERFFSDSRINMVEWANQTDSLKKARSAVIHGGLATIKECIYFGIAPIVVPFGKDQMDNALRVVNKEVGSMIMLDTLTGESLYNAILKAEQNADIQKSMEKMRVRFNEIESKAPSLLLIKKELEK